MIERREKTLSARLFADDANILIIGFLWGMFFSLLVVITMWHIWESKCQRGEDVADCEWSRTPFTPVVKEVE